MSDEVATVRMTLPDAVRIFVSVPAPSQRTLPVALGQVRLSRTLEDDTFPGAVRISSAPTSSSTQTPPEALFTTAFSIEPTIWVSPDAVEISTAAPSGKRTLTLGSL